MRRIALAAVIALGLGGAAWAATASGPRTYAGSGGDRAGLRPTGIGLPLLGTTGTTGAAELPSALRAYHDSGAYARDLATVDAAAVKELKRRLAADKAKPRRVCTLRYHKIRVRVLRKGRPKSERLYRRTRKCRKAPVEGAIDGKPALVLDIDETALSNYDAMAGAGFTAGSVVLPAVTGSGTAIKPTLDLFDAAKRLGVTVFFVTGRPPQIHGATVGNLTGQGYSGWKTLYEKPGSEGVESFKASSRAKIEKQGYDIVANVGDQESDLDGGHADASFKLPNPFYVTADR